ncbi:MAG TPA: polysaccharide deacetylase family protein [bacterium]|nr:polysaccharide deacetylase family protein [bacterium]
MYFLVIAIVFILILAHLRFNIFCKAQSGLRILMYHKISKDKNDKLTVSQKLFDKQMNYIKKNGYNIIDFDDLQDILTNKKQMPQKPLIITFDDGYKNNLEYAVPIMEKYGFKYTVFVVAEYIGKFNYWDEGSENLMNFDELKIILSKNGKIGLHSLTHRNFKDMTSAEFEYDVSETINIFKKNSLEFSNVIAYPYGALPQNENLKNEFKKILEKYGILFGLKIKSKINKIPFDDNYELTRLNIKGTDSFFEFKIKIRKGKTKLF